MSSDRNRDAGRLDAAGTMAYAACPYQPACDWSVVRPTREEAEQVASTHAIGCHWRRSAS